MPFAGIDVGAQSVKAVLFDGKTVLGRKLIVTEKEADSAATEIYNELLIETGLKSSEIESVFATGWGAKDITIADRTSSEQICAARGARFQVLGAKTVVDMGAEGCRVMKLNPEGKMKDFANNSKCASGTGSFIELGAVYLKTSIEKMGSLSLKADDVASLSTTCAVFAESVIISHIHSGESRENIAAGIHESAATRINELLNRMGVEEEVVFVGGAALNMGLVKTIETLSGASLKIPENPQYTVALGAAIQAFLKKGKQRK